MSRFRNSTYVVAVLVGVAILGAQQSRADFILTLTVGGASASYDYQTAQTTLSGGATGSFVPGTSGSSNSITFIGNVGNFVLEISSTLSNASSGQLPATISVNSTDASVSGTAGTASTLVIVASDSGFTVPPAGLAAMTTGVSSTYIFMGTESMTDQSTIGSTNGTLLSLSTGDNSTPPVTNLVTVPGTPYTLKNTLTINGIAGDGNIEGQAETMVNTVPAPAGLVLALSSVPCLGLGFWLRRRQAHLAVAA